MFVLRHVLVLISLLAPSDVYEPADRSSQQTGMRLRLPTTGRHRLALKTPSLSRALPLPLTNTPRQLAVTVRARSPGESLAPSIIVQARRMPTSSPSCFVSSVAPSFVTLCPPVACSSRGARASLRALTHTHIIVCMFARVYVKVGWLAGWLAGSRLATDAAAAALAVRVLLFQVNIGRTEAGRPDWKEQILSEMASGAS